MIKMLGNMRKNIAFFLCIFLSILDGNILARQTDITADSLYGAGTVSGAERAKVHVGSLGGGQSVTAGEHLELNVARACLQFESPSPCISNRCSLSTKQAARLSSSPWITTSDLQSTSGQPSSTQPNS